jgi:hypothetical protein
MNPLEAKAEPAPDDEVAAPVLTPEARRALEEAEARRRLTVATEAAPPEVGGRNGPDPVRYGDWEKDGITSDF